MPETMSAAFDAAVDSLRRAGWMIVIGGEQEPDSGSMLAVNGDLDAAFDPSGDLTVPLELRWRGVAADAQVAFAAQDLILVVPLDEEEGTATVLPQGTPERDLQVVLRSLADLRSRGYVAEAALAYTATDAWQAARSRGDGSKVVFWTTQAHEDAFDEDTDLVGELALQWAGDADEIASVLAATDLNVQVPGSADEVFYLTPNYVED